MQFLILSIVLVLIVPGACVASGGVASGASVVQGTPAGGGSDRAANEALARRYYEIAGGGDLPTLTEVVSPQLVILMASPGEGTSLETLQETLATVRVGLPGFAFWIDDLFSESDFVVARTTITGTHRGTFFGAPPTGNRFEIPAIDIWRVADGKLAANWHLEDILGVMEQIAGVASAGDAATPGAATQGQPLWKTGKLMARPTPRPGLRTWHWRSGSASRSSSRRRRPGGRNRDAEDCLAQ